ncbi:Glycosyl transferase group 1 [Hyella patelloides LEGE 07179]|uniref:Glycosyl transferase group 1 n=1 Tax=Hyella patelloides LEGE 07179 TaxID=945734 RepID=A0A563VMV8_9CYAN|nr:glycosyltransferase [Hyella patelloides]VEP12697.1 Glycosyl transferase group 1 [Hyella patelloides LEGE 07179]
MKILISAYACEPNRGSEPGVGWNIAWELAKYNEVWVLTRPDDGREAIEAELARNPQPNLHFVYFTLPILGGFWQWGSVAFVLHYYLWQVQAYFVAQKLHRQVNFDLAHHVTFVRYSSPSFISLLPIPFVWGTVGGAEAAPKPFWQDFSPRAKVYEILRAFAHKVGERDPFARLTARKSAIARVTTKDTAKQVRKMGASQVAVVPEAALSQVDIAKMSQFPILDTSLVRFISMGRLLHWKGFHLGIRAFAEANLPHAEYWILGDGVEAAKLRLLAMELGVADRVKFWGRLAREQTLSKLSQSHVLVHPSLHDSGGWVCLEGMAAGRPILCLDLGGPGVQVTSQTGIKVPAHNPEQAVRDLAKAMVCLAQDGKLRSCLGQAGREMVQKLYNWEAKGQELTKIYQELIVKDKVTTDI